MLAPSGGEIAADGCLSPAGAGPSGVRKRKSRDEEDKKVCLRGHNLVKVSSSFSILLFSSAATKQQGHIVTFIRIFVILLQILIFFSL